MCVKYDKILSGGISMKTIRILKVEYRNLPLYENGTFSFNFMASDRVTDKTQVFPIQRSIYTQKLEAIIGINASGKTSSLKLLFFAMSIVLNNATLNNKNLLGKELLRDGTEITITFICDNMCWQLRSIIGIKKDNADADRLYYKDEFLSGKSLQDIRSKDDPFRYDTCDSGKQKCQFMQRSTISKETLAMMLPDTSISLSITRDADTSLQQLILFTNVNISVARGATDPAILHAFDPMLDEFNAKDSDDGIVYTIRFRGDKKSRVVYSPFVLNNIISSGTIKGKDILFLIKNVLETGGYLIVDELENHMNKELIHMITDIFKNPKINPRGACLIFTTHYAEILDFMDRKDNIYIARRNQNGIELSNYSKLVRRNDLKKSEVILSNYIMGTAPLYENMQALEDYLCRMIK